MDLKTGHATNSLLGHTLSESDQSTVYDKLNSLAITARIVNVTVALHDIGWYTTDTRVQDNLAILDPSPLETTTDSTSTSKKKKKILVCETNNVLAINLPNKGRRGTRLERRS